MFVGITFVGSMIAGAGPMGILAGPMVCGMYHCIFQRSQGNEVNFSMLFKGFDYFIQCLLPSILMTAIALVVLLGTYVVFFVAFFALVVGNAPPRGAPPEPAFFGILGGLYGGLFLVIMVVVLTLRALFFFAFPLVMDRGLSGWEAVKLSIQATRANLGGLIGLLLLMELLGVLSLVLCCVGPILEMPLNLAMMALAYRQVFPQRDALARFNADDDLDEPDEPAPRRGDAQGSTEVQADQPGRGA